MACYTLPLIAIVLMVAWILFRPHLVRRGWCELADQLGVRYEPETGPMGRPLPGRLSGTYRSRGLRLSLFTEVRSVSDGESRVHFIQLRLDTRQLLQRQLAVHKSWANRYTETGGIPLPDQAFSDRFRIALSEPHDFALKVFDDSGLRQRFTTCVGYRRAFDLKLEKEALHFSTQAADLVLPQGGIEWRPKKLKGMIDALCDLLEAAESAPDEPWEMDHLRGELEAEEYPELGAPLAAYTTKRVRPNLAGGGIVGLSLVLLLLTGMMLRSDYPVQGFVCLGIALPGLFTGVLLSVRRMERVMVFESGLTYRQSLSTHAYPWDQVRFVWQRKQRWGRQWIYTIEREDGIKFQVEPSFPHQGQFMKYVFEGTRAKLGPELIKRHNLGECLEFGPILLQGNRLSCCDQDFQLAKVTSMNANERGSICVQQAKKEVECRGVNIIQVPNLHLLNHLLGEIQRQAGVGAIDKPAARLHLDRVAYLDDPRYGHILAGLTQLLGDEFSTFVVFKDEGSGAFIQFLKLGADAILLDTPVQDLGQEERDRARHFFQELGADLAHDPETGIQAYQTEFSTNDDAIVQAAAAAVGLFKAVFQIPESSLLEAEFGQ